MAVTTTPEQACLDELVAVLAAGATSGLVAKGITAGWADQRETYVKPAVVVDLAGAPERTVSAPYVVSQVDDPASAATSLLVSVGTLDVPIVIDVFASSKPQRARLCAAINADFYKDVLSSGAASLCVMAAGLDGQSISYRRENGITYNDSSEGAGSDEFRASFDVVAEVDELLTVSANRFRELVLEWTVGVSNADLTDPACVERRQIF